ARRSHAPRARRTSIDGKARGRRLRPASRDEQDRRDPEGEAADVREERGAAGGVRLDEREAARPRLQRDPDAEEPERLDLADEDDPEEDERQHLRAWEQHE